MIAPPRDRPLAAACRSSTSTATPARASSLASINPVGPAPTTITSDLCRASMTTLRVCSAATLLVSGRCGLSVGHRSRYVPAYGEKNAAAVIRDESSYSGAKRDYEPTGGCTVLYGSLRRYAAPGGSSITNHSHAKDKLSPELDCRVGRSPGPSPTVALYTTVAVSSLASQDVPVRPLPRC